MVNELRKVTGQILKELRISKSLSLEEASSKVGKSQSWLSMLEHGRLGPPFDTLEQLLNSYGISWERFLRIREEHQEGENTENDTVFMKAGVRCATVFPPDQWKFEEIAEGFEYGLARTLIDRRILDATPLRIRPKSSTGVITSECEQIWLVGSGTVVVEFFNESVEKPSFRKEITEGYAIQIKSKVKHRVTNDSESGAYLFIVRSSIIWAQLSED